MSVLWYAMRSKPRKEDALWRQLRAQGFEVFHPRVRVHRVNPDRDRRTRNKVQQADHQPVERLHHRRQGIDLQMGRQLVGGKTGKGGE